MSKMIDRTEGAQLGVTRERVRQIEKEALGNPLHEKRLLGAPSQCAHEPSG